MSFASVTGSSIGARSSYPFTGITDGSLQMGQQVALVDFLPSQGTYVFSTSFSIFSGSAVSHANTLQASCVVTYNGVTIAKYKIDNQANDDICMTGILFSDGQSELKLTITAADANPGESATAWGYSSGVMDFIRITDR